MGYSDVPHFPSFDAAYQLRAACIASYPMYKGLASLVGMEVLPVEGHEDALEGKVAALTENWGKYDFFYLHVKKTDCTGEDGDFAAKVKKIELFDALLPQLLALNPDVFVHRGRPLHAQQTRQPLVAPGTAADPQRVRPQRPRRRATPKRKRPGAALACAGAPTSCRC